MMVSRMARASPRGAAPGGRTDQLESEAVEHGDTSEVNLVKVFETWPSAP